MLQIRGTVWTAFNAVTEFVDHRKIRGADDRDWASRRLASVWFGQGGRLKEKAWGSALKMAGVN